MPKNDSNLGPEPPEQADPLSATAMFLKSFETSRESARSSPDPFFSEPGPPRPDAQAGPGADRAASNDSPFGPAAAPAQPVTPGTGPGEFTQMFNTLGTRQAPALSPAPARETPVTAQDATAVVKGPSQPSDPGAGEFTRIFVSGSKPAFTPPARPSEEVPRPVPSSPPPSRSKGYSSPGVSDSASAEGSFTQFFSASSAGQSSRPAAPVQSPAPPPLAAPLPDVAMSWQDDPFFKPAPKSSSPEAPSPSVTSILSNLGPSGTLPSGSRQAETVPYRPEPLPSYAPPKPAEPSGPEPGGVTQLLKRLSEVPSSTVPPPPPPLAAPPSSGPGEFTRMISAIKPQAAAPAPPPPAQPAPAAAPAFAPIAPPPLPAVTPPAVAPPKVAMPPAAAPVHAAPIPAMQAPTIPPPPKIAPPPVPALAPPKSKLEAMVPLLLVINTFLLVLLLVVVIFLIKAK